MSWPSIGRHVGLPELGDDKSAFDWLVLNGNRLVVAGLLLVAVFASLLVVEIAVLQEIRWSVPLLYVYSAQVGGNLTLITLVLTINQLVLSRQLSSPGELREQIREVTNYREEVQSASDGDIAPVTPSDFLAQLLQNSDEQVATLDEIRHDAAETELREELDELASSLSEHISRVSRLLSRSDVGTFNALSATLRTNYGEQIREVQLLRSQYRDSLSEAEVDELDELVSRLRQIDVARQYFKTLFIQSELASLSRILLYVGVPAEILSTIMLVGAAGSPAQSFYGAIPAPVVAATVTVGFAPLSILFAFVLRIATVAQRTAAITPFTTHEQRSS